MSEVLELVVCRNDLDYFAVEKGSKKTGFSEGGKIPGVAKIVANYFVEENYDEIVLRKGYLRGRYTIPRDDAMNNVKKNLKQRLDNVKVYIKGGLPEEIKGF